MMIKEAEIRTFIEGATNYFEVSAQQSATVGSPYLVTDGNPGAYEYTCVIGISGTRKGIVYFTAPRGMLTVLLMRMQETDSSDENIKDLVGEVANTISGNARRDFGKNFVISVPTVIAHDPDKVSATHAPTSSRSIGARIRRSSSYAWNERRPDKIRPLRTAVVEFKPLGLGLQPGDRPVYRFAAASLVVTACPPSPVVDPKLALHPQFDRFHIQAIAAPSSRARNLGGHRLRLFRTRAAVGNAKRPGGIRHRLAQRVARLDRFALPAGPGAETALPGAAAEIRVAFGGRQPLASTFLPLRDR